jgi:hypothetical protein
MPAILPALERLDAWGATNQRGRRQCCAPGKEIDMRLADFHIGLEFMEGPFWWRCTDVGTRSIAAIKLVEDDSVWYVGPPYMIEEVLLDEAKLADCHLTEDEHVVAALVEADTSGHPGYPHEAMRRMTEARIKSSIYPRKRLFRFERIWSDGEILHPMQPTKSARSG